MEWEDFFPAQLAERFGYRKCGHAGVCGYFLLAPGQESLWCGAGPCRGCSHSARLVAPLSMGSSQGGHRSSGERAAGCGASKAHAGLLQEGSVSLRAVTQLPVTLLSLPELGMLIRIPGSQSHWL